MLPLRYATNSFRPPLAWNVSVLSWPSRSSVSVIVTPLFRYDSSRRRDCSDAVVVDELGEDLGSGLNQTLVPVSFAPTLPSTSSFRTVSPRRNSMKCSLAVALHPHLQRLGERVDDADAHAVQPAGDLVAVLVELAAGVQHRHRELDARDLLDRVDVDRDAAPVVLDRDRVVGMDHDAHACRSSRRAPRRSSCRRPRRRGGAVRASWCCRCTSRAACEPLRGP